MEPRREPLPEPSSSWIQALLVPWIKGYLALYTEVLRLREAAAKVRLLVLGKNEQIPAGTPPARSSSVRRGRHARPIMVMEGQVMDLREGHLERERRYRPSRSDPGSLGGRRQTIHRGQAVGHRVHLHGCCRLPGDGRAERVPRARGGQQRRSGVPGDLEPGARNPNGADRPYDPAQGTAVVDPTVQ